MSFNIKCIAFKSYDRLLFPIKNEGTPAICDNMRHYAKCHSQTKKHQYSMITWAHKARDRETETEGDLGESLQLQLYHLWCHSWLRQEDD